MFARELGEFERELRCKDWIEANKYPEINSSFASEQMGDITLIKNQAVIYNYASFARNDHRCAPTPSRASALALRSTGQRWAKLPLESTICKSAGYADADLPLDRSCIFFRGIKQCSQQKRLGAR